MSAPAVTEPYYHVIYKNHKGDICEENIEAENVYISKDFDKASFSDNGLTIRVIGGLIECNRFPHHED